MGLPENTVSQSVSSCSPRLPVPRGVQRCLNQPARGDRPSWCREGTLMKLTAVLVRVACLWDSAACPGVADCMIGEPRKLSFISLGVHRGLGYALLNAEGEGRPLKSPTAMLSASKPCGVGAREANPSADRPDT